MLKRTVRRTTKKTFIMFAVAVFLCASSVIVFMIVKNLIPVFNALSRGSSRQIIKPIGNVILKSDLEKKLSEKNVTFEVLEEGTDSASIRGRIKNGPEVLFSKGRDAAWQVNSLKLILAKLNIENKKPVLLDLRYDQPIVKF